MQRWILAIADDLTGALEVGAKFAEYGVSATVTAALALDSPPTARAVVIDTETRHLSAHGASAVIRSLAASAHRYEPWLIYKKTDSTLRGNIGAELRALLHVWPDRRIIYSGAYPALGRTVRDGRLFVQGVAVHRTEFAADPLNPCTTAGIRAILGGVPATILDAESEHDVSGAASAFMAAGPARQVAAGPASFASALASSLGGSRKARRPLSLKRVLVINGSRHPASSAQIAYARDRGGFPDLWSWFDEDVRGEGMERALRTGELVRRRLESSPFEALIVFGGDTAFGVHRALGAPPFDPICEIAPGAPLSRCAGLYWITKAGGFGAPDILDKIRRRLS